MRIAIIGTGISGLTAAHLLHPEHELTVFEAGDHVGGHTNTIRIDTDEGTWDVDTGFIVLSDRNYPSFEALLDELAVAVTPAEAEVLGAFPYQPNEAVLHTDRALLARRRGAWSAWKYHLPRERGGRCAVTYYMNHLQALPADQTFCVTLNRTAAIDPEQAKPRWRGDAPVPALVAAPAVDEREELEAA